MKDIEQFLRENAPDMPDDGQFMVETNARLNSVEGIKKTVDGERRRWRKALVIALVVGLAVGCLLTLLVLFCPFEPVQAEDSTLIKALEAMQHGKEFLFGIIAALAIALGVVSITKKREAL